MKETIETRFKELISTGQNLIKVVPWYDGEPAYWIPEERIAEYQQWLSSSANLISLIAPPDSIFGKECPRITADQEAKTGIPSRMVQKIYGLLSSAKDEWERGLLRKIEYMVVAETFDDFLDQAQLYHKGNKKIEASILASAILEDTVKRIAKKNDVDTKGVSLEPLIDSLVKSGIFTPVKAKRVKVSAAVRNHALHAEWDDFDIKDAGELIAATRDLIDAFL